MNKPKNTYLLRDMLFSSLWLLFLAADNQNGSTAIISIVPYLVPVVVIAWRYAMGWSFVLAALGTLAAMPGDYMNSHNMVDLYWAAFTTYLKLTAAATGIFIGKNTANRRKDDG